MKKKWLIALVIAVLCLFGIVGAAWHFLPAIAFRIIGNAIGGRIEADRTAVSYRDGLLRFSMEGVKVTGEAQGTVGRCQLDLLPTRGVYVKSFSMSDFNLKIKKVKGRFAFYPVPVELAEITKGFLDYGGKRYTIRELKVTNFNTDKTMQFWIDAGIEGIGNVKTHGEGIFSESRKDVRGEYLLAALNMARVFRGYEGIVDSHGTFTYRGEKLVVDGEAHTPHFSLWEKFLAQPVPAENVQCRLHVQWEGERSAVSLEGLSFKGSPLSLEFRTAGKKLLHLALAMDYIRVPDILAYVDLAALSGQRHGPFSYVEDGEVRVGNLVFERNKPIRARIDLRNASGGAEGVSFTNVNGTLQVDGQKLLLSDFTGQFGRGRIFGVSGVVPLNHDQETRIKGEYALYMDDLSRFYKSKEVEALAGIAAGSLEVRGGQDEGFTISTNGMVRDGEFLWRGLRLQASSDYTFDGKTLSFDRLSIRNGATSLALKGRLQGDRTSLALKGSVEGMQIAQLFLPRNRLKGTVGVDGEIEAMEGRYFAKGRADLTRLAFEIPGMMKKTPGVESTAYVVARGRPGDRVFIDDLYCTVGSMRAHASGELTDGTLSDLHAVVDVPKMEELAGLFFFRKFGVRGGLKADVRIEELHFPIWALPRMKGVLTVKNGAVRLPVMRSPLRDIDLSCNFTGERFVLRLGSACVGGSRLTEARLVIEGLESPVFVLSAEADHLDLADFAAPDRRPLRLPVIAENDLFSRVTGTFLFKARRFVVGNMAATDLKVSGAFKERTLSISEGGMGTGSGSLDLKGNVRFAGTPQVNVTGELKELKASEVFSLFGGNSEILDGTGSITGNLRLEGRSGEELRRSASGTISVLSRDGAIRKWNLVSKLLAVTNLYDFLRGRVDLKREGLVYRKLSASFEGGAGVFHTSDFLIESPSMIIAGQGDLDVAGRTISGKMVVSPLVAMDRVIDRIPVVRNIVKEKGSGFVFFVYDVRGPLNDPEFKSTYAQSMGRRALNMLWNTIRLPKSMVDGLPGRIDRFPKELFER